MPVALGSKQIWERLGLVYCAGGEAPWRVSHAYVPTAFVLSETVIRVVVAFLDGEGMGRLGYVDVDSVDPTRVLAICDQPSLDLGRPGTFDEHGVTPLCYVKENTALYLFYAGWQRSASVRYSLFTGLARSDDYGASFTRVSEAPVLDRCDGELLVRTGGFVFRHGGRWVFAYMAGSEQSQIVGKMTPTYDMMTLTSSSATEWSGRGSLSLSPRRPDEFGFGRPWVLSEGDRCRMWLSVRSATVGYYLTYAESLDGLVWERHDNALEFIGHEGSWDSQTKSFACIVDVPTARFMFYNGNGYGATGFGVARLVEDRVVR